jgi:hypothetical protein
MALNADISEAACLCDGDHGCTNEVQKYRGNGLDRLGFCVPCYTARYDKGAAPLPRVPDAPDRPRPLRVAVELATVSVAPDLPPVKPKPAKPVATYSRVEAVNHRMAYIVGDLPPGIWHDRGDVLRRYERQWSEDKMSRALQRAVRSGLLEAQRRGCEIAYRVVG